MSWPSFALAYAVVALLGLLLSRRRFRGHQLAAVRTLAGVTLLLCIFDGVAESRNLWVFPDPLRLYILNVPMENILITAATTMNSLLFFVLFDERPRS